MNANIRQASIYDASAIARVHIDSWRTTYRGIVPQSYLDSLDFAARTERWQEQLARDEALIFVIEEAGKIYGFSCGGRLREPIEDYDAEIYALYLLQEYQHYGSGRSLVFHLAKSLKQRAFRHLAVWVLEENPSCGFYERLGGQRIAEKSIEIGGISLVEVAYGWNINELLQ